MIQPLLYELFSEIRREQDLSGPGLQEYYLLFDLLERKNDDLIKNFNDLVFVLETIWLKSNQDKYKFRKLLQLLNSNMMVQIEILNNEPEKQYQIKMRCNQKHILSREVLKEISELHQMIII